MVCNIKSSERRYVASSNTSSRFIASISVNDIAVTAFNGMDSMADTCCAGRNWHRISSTGYTCDVYPFKGDYAPTTDIPVATCATKVLDQHGRAFILIGHEMLYFGDQMDKSLLCPNQIRHHGGRVQDDYTRDEPFGIGLEGGDVFIPLKMKGVAVGFDSMMPTSAELEELPHVVMTSSNPWKPKDVELRSIAQASVYEPRARYIHETDMVLGDISGALVEHISNERIVASVTTTDKHSSVTPENISRKWRVGLESAKKTLQVTTQTGVRTTIHPFVRRFRVDHLNWDNRFLKGRWYSDTLLAKTKSLSGNQCSQLYTNGKFTVNYPIKSRKEVGDTLIQFCQDVGVPEILTADLAPEMSGHQTEWMKTVRRRHIDMRWTEKGRKNQNMMVENEIGVLKRRWRKRMTEKGVPGRLWDCAMAHKSEILTRMSRGPTGRTGHEEVTGNTPDIAEWLDFEFYDRVWVLHQAPSTEENKRLGRWLGVAHRVGSKLCYWILLHTGQVIASTTVEHVTKDEMSDESVSERVRKFDEQIAVRLDDKNFVLPGPDRSTPYIEDTTLDPAEPPRKGIVPTDEECGDMIQEDKLDADECTDCDQYIGAQLLLDVGGEPVQARVLKRAIDMEGNRKGKPHRNPVFDTRAYMVELEDGTIDECTANIIAENIYAQVDGEGNQRMMLKEIVDHKRDNSALSGEEGYTLSYNGNKVLKKSTKGWYVLVEWKDGTTNWIAVKDMKDSNPIELAECAVANQLDKEPAFAWWVHETLRHRSRVIGKVKKKYWRTDSKFGIKLPHSVEEALRIDEETGTDFWRKAIDKELRKAKVAWEAREDLDKEEVRAGRQLIGYTEIKCHMAFDVKMDFTRKARFCAGGHMTEAPLSITYSSVASRDSVRIAFTCAALNGLDVFACDIGNAYLNAPCREKVWFLGGDEAGEDKGKILVIVRALYGLKSSGASWRATLAQTLSDMGFKSSVADPDVWRRESKKEDGTEYYELLLVYVDDILLVSHAPRSTLEAIGEICEIKDGKIDEPETHLGAQVYMHHLPDGTSAWALTCEKCIKNAIATVEMMLDGDARNGAAAHKLKSTAVTPFPTSHKPELDFTKELGPELLSRYRQLIGILRWAVELGRVDIYLETALLSQYLASPREGHLEAVCHILAYLQKHPKSAIVFDAGMPMVDESAFRNVPPSEWKDFYGDLAEELPYNMPDPKGRSVRISCFVDANHAGNVVTRRSHTGIIIFLNNAPIIWHSKKQNTVESSSFGSEFVALRAARDMIVALRYKLRMFGIPIDGPADVYCDNEGVVKNTSAPESTLTKRHNAINFHSVREAVAAQIMRVGKEDGETNLADAFTKVLGRLKRYQLFSNITYSSMCGSHGPPKRPGTDEFTQGSNKKHKGA